MVSGILGFFLSYLTKELVMSGSCIIKQMHCLLSVQSPCAVSMRCCHAPLIVQL